MKNFCLILVLMLNLTILARAQRPSPDYHLYIPPMTFVMQGGFTGQIARYLPVFAAAPNCIRVGQLYWDSVLNSARVCSVTGSPGTWGSLASGGGGPVNNTTNGASGVSPLLLSGTVFTGGGTTNTKPQLLVEPGGTTSTGWSNNGTMLGVNAPSGFTGNLAAFQLNGVDKFTVTSAGASTFVGSSTATQFIGTGNFPLAHTSRGFIGFPSDGVISFFNNGLSDFGRLQLGGTTSSFPALARSTTFLKAQLGDGTEGGGFLATTYNTVTNCLDSAGAAACGSATAGSFVIDAASTSTVVSTTNVTANSQVILTRDNSLGTRLSVTCNTQSSLVLGAPYVSARTAGASFTVTIDAGPTTNPMCVNYEIRN